MYSGLYAHIQNLRRAILRADLEMRSLTRNLDIGSVVALEELSPTYMRLVARQQYRTAHLVRLVQKYKRLQ